jgi:hypothetical protein
MELRSRNMWSWEDIKKIMLLWTDGVYRCNIMAYNMRLGREVSLSVAVWSHCGRAMYFICVRCFVSVRPGIVQLWFYTKVILSFNKKCPFYLRFHTTLVQRLSLPPPPPPHRVLQSYTLKPVPATVDRRWWHDVKTKTVWNQFGFCRHVSTASVYFWRKAVNCLGSVLAVG